MSTASTNALIPKREVGGIIAAMRPIPLDKAVPPKRMATNLSFITMGEREASARTVGQRQSTCLFPTKIVVVQQNRQS